MSPRHRTFQRDFNDQFADVVAKWQIAYDALHHVEWDFIWDDTEKDVLKELQKATTFMLSTKRQLRKVALLRANSAPETSNSADTQNPQSVVG